MRPFGALVFVLVFVIVFFIVIINYLLTTC